MFRCHGIGFCSVSGRDNPESGTSPKFQIRAEIHRSFIERGVGDEFPVRRRDCETRLTTHLGHYLLVTTVWRADNNGRTGYESQARAVTEPGVPARLDVIPLGVGVNRYHA